MEISFSAKCCARPGCCWVCLVLLDKLRNVTPSLFSGQDGPTQNRRSYQSSLAFCKFISISILVKVLSHAGDLEVEQDEIG